MLEERTEARAVQGVYVLFCDAPDKRLLRPLRPGFRHCFVMLCVPGGVITIDPLCGQIEVMMHGNADVTLLIHRLRSCGLTVVETTINPVKKGGGFSVSGTCVGIAKRLLGIRNIWIQTPYHLFCYLNKRLENPKVQNGASDGSPGVISLLSYLTKEKKYV